MKRLFASIMALCVCFGMTQTAFAQSQKGKQTAPAPTQQAPTQAQQPATQAACEPVVDAAGAAVHHRTRNGGICLVSKMEYVGLGRTCTKKNGGWDCVTTVAQPTEPPTNVQRCGVITNMPSQADLEKMVPNWEDILKGFDPKSITLDDILSGTIAKKLEGLSAEVLSKLFANKVPLEVSATFWSTAQELCPSMPSAQPQYTVTFKALDQSAQVCLMENVGCVPLQSLSPEGQKHVIDGLSSIANTAMGKVLKEMMGKVQKA